MQGVREFFQAIGHFWAITIIGGIVLVVAVLGLYMGGVIFTSKVVLPAQKNLQVQSANNQYQANQASQMYQDTFLSQSNKTYQQITIDKLNDDQAKASGDQTEINDAYAATAADIHIFCGDAQKLTPVTRAEFTPGEANLYQSAC